MAARKPDGLNAKDEALRLVDDGLVHAETMLMCALKSMSDDEAWMMLDDNELSPRFPGGQTTEGFNTTRWEPRLKFPSEANENEEEEEEEEEGSS